MTRSPTARSKKRAGWSLLISLLLGILVAIDLERCRATGVIVIGRENSVLTGSAAEIVIGLFALGAVSFFFFGLYSSYVAFGEPGVRADHEDEEVDEK